MTGQSDGDRDLVKRARQVRRLLRATSADLGRLEPRQTPGLPKQEAGAGPGASSPSGGHRGQARAGGAARAELKEWSRAEVQRLGVLLGALQERLFARAKAGVDRRRLLLVLQATDCAGKDGTVRSVVGAMNPLGMQIKAFGPPNDVERQQHYLWRVSQALPPAGYVGVFNRSHYEEVLVARVRKLVPEDVWQRRYDEINAFEQALVDDGLILVKVMLHLSYEEQGERLLARLDDPTKRWKFNPSDLDDRDRWDDYQRAYGDMVARCSAAAPWYVVPADRKWYRNWAVANLLLAHLDEAELTYPAVELDLAGLRSRLRP